MFLMAVIRVNVHDIGGFACTDDFFQWAVFAVLAAGAVNAVGYFITVLANNFFVTHLVVIFVLLVTGDDAEVTINNNKWVRKQVDNSFATGFDEVFIGRAFHNPGPVMTLHDKGWPWQSVKSTYDQVSLTQY